VDHVQKEKDHGSPYLYERDITRIDALLEQIQS
jgi:hypothetical protein